MIKQLIKKNNPIWEIVDKYCLYSKNVYNQANYIIRQEFITNNNKLTNQNIENIIKIFTERKDVEYISKLVSNKDIAENDYNLSVSTYVEKEDTREKIDINVLNKEIEESTYLVQLSDHESFGLSVVESLMLGTPVIVTDIPAFKEVGCKHGINAIICNLNMDNIDMNSNGMLYEYF